MICKIDGCKQHIIFVKAQNGKEICINLDSVSPEDIMLLAQQTILNYKPAIHIPHWVTCGKPEYYRGKK